MNTFDFFSQEDKYFFAGLFNTAQNNFDLSLKELAQRINIKSDNGIDIIKMLLVKKERNSNLNTI